MKIGLIVVASMAVDPATGARCGPDRLFANLEYGMLRLMGAIDAETPLVTTARDLQLVEEMAAALYDDIPVDVICLATRTIRLEKALEKPEGVKWDKISMHSESVHLLRKLRMKSRIGGNRVQARDRAAWKLAVQDNIDKRMKTDRDRVGREFAMASAMVESLPEFQRAAWVRAPRGLAQHHLRLAALKAGKMLLVPMSELQTPQMLLLDPSKIAPAQLSQAVTEGGACRSSASPSSSRAGPRSTSSSWAPSLSIRPPAPGSAPVGARRTSSLACCGRWPLWTKTPQWSPPSATSSS
mmetsp:Transcript_80969/g.234712  ORF Transcript_80969/g.234712 Transcript_80969/m.234712 type:complete len:297 (-) Transcript_80969:142-1032(-)